MVNSSTDRRLNFNLSASSPLNGHSTIIDGASLVEITTQSIVSISPFTGSETIFNIAISKIFEGGIPSATKALERKGKKECVLLPSSHGQWFFCFDNDTANPLDTVRSLIGKKASNRVAITDQSDAWVILALTGSLVYRTLERICAIDCSPWAMPVGTTARTMIGHLGAIILRRTNNNDGSPCFWLMSARSSAASFLQAINESPPFSER
jgi:heterotetrameric sarcosine oxidase gamma subunit